MHEADRINALAQVLRSAVSELSHCNRQGSAPIVLPQRAEGVREGRRMVDLVPRRKAPWRGGGCGGL